MEGKTTRIGLFGGREEDLLVLSELHKRDTIEIAFLYEEIEDAVGLEIAEILGIARHSVPDQLQQAPEVDYLVVCEPRERFERAIAAMPDPSVKVLGASEALRALCGLEEQAPPADTVTVPQDAQFYSIEDTLGALERLFDRTSLLRFLLDVCVRHAHASTGSIMLYSPDADELYIGFATGLSERVVKNTRQKLGTGIAGTVAREKRARLLRMGPDDILYAQERERVDIASAISVPLLWENRLLGVLNVSTSRGERDLGQEDFENLKKLSRRISKILAASLKLQELQGNHLERRIRRRVGELTENPAVFQEKIFTLASYLSELMGIDTVEIYLNTHEGDWFLLGGSNSRFSIEPQKVRCDKGVLARCFLEQQPIILQESTENNARLTELRSSLVYHPLSLVKPLGVLVTGFSEPHKLQEYLAVREAIGLEIARFVSSELRSRMLKREVSLMGAVSEAAPGILNCRNIGELCETVSRTIANVLGCEHVSTRLKTRTVEKPFFGAFHQPRDTDTIRWTREDELIFTRLARKREPFSESHLSFEPAVGRRAASYDSLLAVPVIRGNDLAGGIIAYNKRSPDPLDESIFTDFDRTVVTQVLSFALPVLDSAATEEPAAVDDTEQSYQSLLQENRSRLLEACEREVQRAERYHYPFTFLLFKIPALASLFEDDHQHALELVEEITNGIRTRTRKTDFLSWISPDEFALLSLEGSKRVRFLISRVLLYLEKDLTAFGAETPDGPTILLGQAGYPGAAGSAEELLAEAKRNLQTPPSQ